ncbi:MAG: hypothetical protein GY934_09975 [Gammaproteobacteria bacterium]|nr:hypothetical protein [Gammaproteobacteria bacterium]
MNSKKLRPTSNATMRNGITNRIQLYLNTLGDWSTYRGAGKVEDVPGIVSNTTLRFLGIGLDKDGGLKIQWFLAAISLLHALEQVTSSTASLMMRLITNGRPVAKYQGVIIRQNPTTPKKASLLNFATRGRVANSGGYYFQEGGTTWQVESFTFVLGEEESRVITRITSAGLPRREHFFDRPVTLKADTQQAAPVGADAVPRQLSIQSAVDIVKGYVSPLGLAGYIGSTSELDNSTCLGSLKRLLFMAIWFLVDESERDLAPGDNFVDYDSLVKGNTLAMDRQRPAGPHPYYQSSLPYGQQYPPASRYYDRGSKGSSVGWPTASSPPPPPPPDNSPYYRVKERYQAPNGQSYPLLICGIEKNPITMIEKAKAIYYDGNRKTWGEIEDEHERVRLAQAVKAGTVKVTDNWQYYL